jgi:adenosine kinase
VSGARYLVTNDYEWALIQSKTGWTHEELITKADICVTTHGAAGCVIEVDGDAPIKVPAAPVGMIADPTGVGDAFRAGFLTGQAWGASLERSAQVGSVLASIVLEGVGTQEYTVEPSAFCTRVEEAYGAVAADEVRAYF